MKRRAVEGEDAEATTPAGDEEPVGREGASGRADRGRRGRGVREDSEGAALRYAMTTTGVPIVAQSHISFAVN